MCLKGGVGKSKTTGWCWRSIKDSPAICLSIRIIIQDRGKTKTYFKPPTSFSVISAVQPMIVWSDWPCNRSTVTSCTRNGWDMAPPNSCIMEAAYRMTVQRTWEPMTNSKRRQNEGLCLFVGDLLGWAEIFKKSIFLNETLLLLLPAKHIILGTNDRIRSNHGAFQIRPTKHSQIDTWIYHWEDQNDMQKKRLQFPTMWGPPVMFVGL